MNYRKIRKLLTSPRLFVIDAINNKIKDEKVKPVTNTIPVKKNIPSPKREIVNVSQGKNVFPEWFNSRCGHQIKQSIKHDRPVYLYIPWIAEHSDALIDKIKSEQNYDIYPMGFVNNIQSNDIRKDVAIFARNSPQLYRRMIVRCLAQVREQITGVIFTFDWFPAMRIIANVCEELEIPRILIPHESVFIDRDKYYVDIVGKSSLPVADVILGWGDLQKDIFTERGYPEERFYTVGAPKFDVYHDYKPYLTRAQFHRLFGLDSNKRTILFAAQPLDSQLDTQQARQSQRQAIDDLLEYASQKDCQLLIRLPPSKDEILNRDLKVRLQSSSNAAVDDALCYLVTPEEALYHSDMITSINSTMLLEGALLGKPALSVKYVDFSQLFEQVNIPFIHHKTELFTSLDNMLSQEWTFPAEGLDKAANIFGCGIFDGQANKRIADFLNNFSGGDKYSSFKLNGPINRLTHNQALDVVGVPSSDNLLSDGTQKYLRQLINARTLVSTTNKDFDLKSLCAVEVFLQWGITKTQNKIRQRVKAAELSRPVLIIEDGFIRSMDIGLDGSPGLSIIIDDRTAYYDATKQSRLSLTLQGEREISAEQKQRARHAIDKIVFNKVSKYNHAKCLPIKVGTKGRKKVLVIDQRLGDQSVASGLANEASFERMLHDAIRNHPECDIVVKQHPDAIKGGKSSYYNDERLAFTKYVDNVFTINFDINPYALLELVDDVYVVTSGMGFEALMAGKNVHCYGMPFYAGWGVTEDQIVLPTRTRVRTVEELFYFSYIEASRYFDPDLDRQVQVEELVDYIVRNREW